LFRGFDLRSQAIVLLCLLTVSPALSGESAAKLYRDGMQALSRGDRENARYFFRRALEVNPGYREAALADGDLNLQMGDLKRARESYDRMLSVDCGSCSNGRSRHTT
jgi:Tfp pilus assembly protein PilF